MQKEQKINSRKIKAFNPTSAFVMVSTVTGNIIVPGDKVSAPFNAPYSNESIQNYVPVHYSGMIDKLGNMILEGDVLTNGCTVFYDVNHGTWCAGVPGQYLNSDTLWATLKSNITLGMRSWEEEGVDD